MSLVPTNAEYIIEAQLPTVHIDKVFEGLDADLMFSAFNTQTSQIVEGKLTYVSADVLEDRYGNPYYQVKAEPTERGLEKIKENGFFFVPGMPAEVVIKTGRRTMLSYLLKPFSRMFAKAFNED